MHKVSQALFKLLWYKKGGHRVYLHWLPLKRWSGLKKGTAQEYLEFLNLIEREGEREALIFNEGVNRYHPSAKNATTYCIHPI